MIFYIALLSFTTDLYGAKDEPPTAFGEFDFGMTTYKSELVQSNDTTNAIRYSLGAFVGEEKVISVAMTTETLATTFLLNDAISEMSSTNIILSYHMWNMSVGAIINSGSQTATTSSGTLFNLTSSGFGFQEGVRLPFGKGSEFVGKVSSVATSEVIEVSGATVTLGPSMEIDIGASFDVTRNLIDLIVGYRMNSYIVTTDADYAESISSTYFGLGVDLMF